MNSSVLKSVLKIIPLLLLALPTSNIVTGKAALAQPISPAEDGTNSRVTQDGNRFDIDGGTASRDGANLFHSLQKFGLSQDQIANFLAHPGIRNILTRIVGGEPSLIDGLIQVSGGNANLFLLNPAGIVFGANAKLNVPADFTATTATGIGFGEGLWFNAFGDNNYQNLVGEPSEFAFDLVQPGNIVNNGRLEVAAGRNLNLIGAAVVNTGTIAAPGGNITLVSVPGTNLVRISQEGSPLSLEIAPPRNSNGLVLPFRALDLPGLLTGAKGIETGLNVTQPGTVSLTDSGEAIPTEAGTVVIAGTVDVTPEFSRSNGKGNVILSGNEIDLVESAQVKGSGNLTLQPTSSTQAIALGGLGNTEALDLTAAELGKINGFSSLTIGQLNGTGIITIGSDGEVNLSKGIFDLTLEGGDLSFDKGIILGDGSSLTLNVGAVTSNTTDTEIVIGGPASTLKATATTWGQEENPIDTSARNITINTAASRGNQFVGVTGSLESLNLNAGRGTVNLVTGGSIRDTDMDPDITAGAAQLNVGSHDIGTKQIPLHTDLFTLKIPAAGNVWIEEVNGLFLDSARIQSNLNVTASRGGLAIGSVNAGADITLTAEDIALNQPIGGQGNLRLQPLTADSSIDLGTGIGKFFLSRAELANLQDGFKSITIGRSDGRGTITIGGPGLSFADSVLFQSPGGQIVVNSPITGTGDASITLQSNLTSLNSNITTDNQNIIINSPLTLSNSVTLNTGTEGGEIKFNGTVDGKGSLSLSAGEGQIIFNQNVGSFVPLDSLTVESAGQVKFQEIEAKVVDITAKGNIETGNIDVSSPEGAGGAIKLNSSQGSIVTRNLNTAGTTGGEISLKAGADITTGVIQTRGSVDNGGDVKITSLGDLEAIAIDAQGGDTGTGGKVNISAGESFRVTGTFKDSSGNPFSISTAGGLGGAEVNIETGGKTGSLVPFQIGDASRNGTVGTINTDGEKLSVNPEPTDSQVIDSEPTAGESTDKKKAESAVAEAQIVQVEGTEVTETKVEKTEVAQAEVPKPEVTPSVVNNSDSTGLDSQTQKVVIRQETALTNQYADYLDISAKPIENLTEVQNTLRQIEVLSQNQIAEIKPAVLYAFFVPAEESESMERAEKDATKNSPIADSIWEFNGSRKRPVVPDNKYPQGRDHLELVLVTANGAIYKKKIEGATRDEVLTVARQFQDAIANRQSKESYLPQAQQLYQWLVAPLTEELKTQQINNLTFVMDSGLRSIPIAALHDGREFIIEKYSVGLMPSFSLTERGTESLEGMQVLAMGADQFTNQQPLPSVPVELAVISHQIWPGESFLNQDFTVSNLQQARKAKRFGIIHLATHASFRKGEPSNSYIQFWDSKLSLDRLSELHLNDQPTVELLVLSACRTALGDTEAELGFSGLALKAGVKSALGSLWYVSDRGTLALMVSFYEHLRANPQKAEALRQAQLALLRGEIKLQDGAIVRGDERIALPSASLPEPDLTHPFYWSGFTLIGNPW